MLKIDTSRLMEKEMDRKDFIKSAAFGLIAMSGVAAALKATGVLQIDNPLQDKMNTSVTGGAASYGISAYGGAIKK